MKQLLKTLLARAGYSLRREPPNIVTGNDLTRDLRLVLHSRPGTAAIDVGANVGDLVERFHAILPEAEIHAFEPNPMTFERLRQRHANTPRVTLNQAGVGESEGMLRLNTVGNHALNSFLPLTSEGRSRLDVADTPTVVEVPVVTLDHYAEQRGMPEVELLKIDTQGYEMHVLRGARELFRQRRIHAVLLELNFVELYTDQARPTEVIAYLREQGFDLVDFYEKCRHNPVLAWCTALFVRRVTG